MKKPWIVGMFVALIVVIIGVWFWSLGSVPADAAPQIVLAAAQGPVQLLTKSDANWKNVSAGTVLHEADEIRTGDGATATIRFFGAAESRLREHSDVVIDHALVDANHPSAIGIRLKLATGRVWSRVSHLLDIDSSFVVQTDNVVATVRGTAFDVNLDATGTEIGVLDSGVDVLAQNPKGANAPDVYLPEGSQVRVDPSGKVGKTELIPRDSLSSDWVVGNVNADDAFAKDVQNTIADRYSKGGVSSSDSIVGGLVGLSERIHLMFAGNRGPALAGQYFGRRLFGIKRLVDDGKSGLAIQSFAAMLDDTNNVLKTPSGQASLPFLRKSTDDMIMLLTSVGPSSTLYRLKQRLEDLNQSLGVADPAAALYARLSGIDARLDEASVLIAAQAFPDAGSSLDTAEQGIGNVDRDIQQATSVSDAHLSTLQTKLAVVKARDAALRTRLLASEVPPAPSTTTDQTATSTAATAPVTPTSTTGATPSAQQPTTPAQGSTNTAPVPPPAVAPPPTTPPPTETWARIGLSAQPNPVDVGSVAQLHVLGYRADGSSSEITSSAQFKVIGNLGTLNGPTFTATQAGSVTISATVSNGGTPQTVSTTLQVNAPVQISSLNIVPQQQYSTNVMAGTSVPLIATVTYTSGLTANVTPNVVWSTSDANIGSVSNGTFSAWVNGSGSVTITGAYTEGRMTKSYSIVFNVSPSIR